MTFDEILAQVITLLRQEGRVSYRALRMMWYTKLGSVTTKPNSID